MNKKEREKRKKISSRSDKLESRKLAKKETDATAENEKTMDIKKPVKQKKKSRFKFCCFSCLIVFIIGLLLALYVISASGLVNVPGLSSLVFTNEPEPTREVEPETKIEQVMEEKIYNSIVGGSNRLALTEQELTGLLAQDKNMEKANIAIEDEQIEIFAKVNQKGFDNLYITLVISPEIKENQLKLGIKKTKIGKLPLPAFIANYIVNLVLANYQVASHSSFQYIDQLSLVDHNLVIKGDLEKLFLLTVEMGDDMPQEMPKTVDPEDLRSISPPGE